MTEMFFTFKQQQRDKILTGDRIVIKMLGQYASRIHWFSFVFITPVTVCIILSFH